MKKTVLVVFSILLICFSFNACNVDLKEPDKETNEILDQEVFLTENNFYNFFTVNISANNLRKKNPDKALSRYLCDINVSIVVCYSIQQTLTWEVRL